MRRLTDKIWMLFFQNIYNFRHILYLSSDSIPLYREANELGANRESIYEARGVSNMKIPGVTTRQDC